MISGLSGIDTGIQTSQKKPAVGHKAATEAEIKQSLETGFASETATLLNNTAGDRSPVRFTADDQSNLIQVISRSTGESLLNVYTGAEKQVIGAKSETPGDNIAVRGKDAVNMVPQLPAMLIDIAQRVPDSGESPRLLVADAFEIHRGFAGAKAEEAGRIRPAMGAKFDA